MKKINLDAVRKDAKACVQEYLGRNPGEIELSLLVIHLATLVFLILPLALALGKDNELGVIGIKIWNVITFLILVFWAARSVLRAARKYLQ